MGGRTGSRARPPRICGLCGKPITGRFFRDRKADYHDGCYDTARQSGRTKVKDPYRCNKCHRPMKGTTAYDGACECGGLIEVDHKGGPRG